MRQVYTTLHPIQPSYRRQLQRYALLLMVLIPGLLIAYPAAGRGLAAARQPTEELPVTFTRIGQLPLDSNKVEIVGERAYLDDDPGAIHVVDISQPASPRLLATYQREGHTYRLQQVVGATAYLAFVDTSVFPTEYGLEIVDLADPEAPRVLGRSTITGIVALVVVGDLAYVLNAGFLYVLDVADPAAISVVGSTVLDIQATALAVEGNLVYAAGSVGGTTAVQVVDMADPTMPQPGKWYGGFGGTQGNDVAVAESVAFVGSLSFPGGMVTIHDTLDPASEHSITGYYDTDNAVISLRLVGNLVYVGTQYSQFKKTAGRLMLLAFEPPRTLKLLGEYTDVGEVGDIEVVGSFIYVTGGGDFQILRAVYPYNVLLPVVAR